jgi:hydrogenase maturation factor HypF (carbamoyltransferase family)
MMTFNFCDFCNKEYCDLELHFFKGNKIMCNNCADQIDKRVLQIHPKS